MIKEVIVVEGRHDESRLKAMFDCEIITTNGSEISDETIELLKHISEERGIIVFTDPDSPGERIRSIIRNNVPNAKHAFLHKKDCQGKRNVGVEYATNEAIINALESVYEVSEAIESITWDEFVRTGVMTYPNAKALRKFIGEDLHLGFVNNKQLFKRLNMFGLTKDNLAQSIEKFDNQL